MSRWKTAWLAVSALILISAGPPSVSAQIFYGNKSTGSGGVPGGPAGHSGPQANAPKYFAILGEVPHPNTFELPTSAPSLVKFIEFAGGLKSSASGQIRIIRGGRLGQQAYFSPKSTLSLMPGDLVIVEGKSAQGTIFRGGNSTTAASNQFIQIGLVGVRAWPIILEVPSERATIRWITQQLGQSEDAANNAAQHAIIPRTFQTTSIDSRLAEYSVIVFDESLIDGSRLPTDLPAPETMEQRRQKLQQPLAAAPQNAPTSNVPAQPADTEYPGAASLPPNDPNRSGLARPVGPVAPGGPQPGVSMPFPVPGVAAVPHGQYGAMPGGAMPGRAMPGHAAIAPTPRPTSAPARQPDRPIDPADEEFVKELLTHPNSVELESPSGRASVTRTPTGSGSQSPTNRSDSRSARPGDSKRAPGFVAEPEFTGREAEKPFESSTENEAGSEPKSEAGADRAGADLSALPLTSRSGEFEASESRSPDTFAPADGRPSLAQEATASAHVDSPAGRISSPGSATFRSETTTGTTDGAGQTPETVSMTPLSPTSEDASAVDPSSGSNSSRLLAGRSQIVPGKSFEWSWSLIAVCLFADIGLLFAAAMFFTIAKPQPVTAPEPTARSRRAELDQLINNELPIEEETVLLPHQTRHFGKAVTGQSRRIDAAHPQGPKRPHFLRRRGEGEIQPTRPQVPDQPASGGADRGDESRYGQSGRPQSGRKNSESRSPNRTATPLRPAANAPAATTLRSIAPTSETEFAARRAESPGPAPTETGTPTIESPVTESAPRGRQFRVDSGHPVHRQQSGTSGSGSATRSAPATTFRSVATAAPSVKSASDSDDSGQDPATSPVVLVPRKPIRAPHSRTAFAARSGSAGAESTGAGAPSASGVAESRVSAGKPDGAASESPSVVPSRVPSRVASVVPSGAVIPPAQSVAAGADLLDRILFSVQREQR